MGEQVIERRTGRRRGAHIAAAAAAVLAMALLAVQTAYGTRLKDIASFSGSRTNQLVGYGLVVGLSGTGDKRGSEFTVQSIYNMLDRMGVRVDRDSLKPKNVAAVMVTAQMPVTAKPGTRMDVTISSLGDSSSLLGGVLLVTPLKGIDGNIYAIAQGPLLVGGVSAEGAAATVSKNITTVGMIPGGANVERAIPFEFNQQEGLSIALKHADFSTAQQVAQKINDAMGGAFAAAVDGGTVALTVPDQHKGNLVPLLANLENLEIRPDNKARVVVDEKTGTVVVGSEVRLSRVAVAHGNLQIVISENPQVSQPGPFSQGKTVVTPQTNVAVHEQNNRLMLVEGATLQELVDGLNAIGATPRDLISIIRTLKSAGALHADLEVI
ncbi:MAG: flagellar basal body P-ring protein FlgI [Desulfovibrio sp.]|nr:flagellar basal body P-ring protein FlgI [Desulfovibrio sp.]